jgi:hypothetical protein
MLRIARARVPTAQFALADLELSLPFAAGMRSAPHLILSSESDIYHHTQTDYERAFERAGFSHPSVDAIFVDESIRHLLMEESFRIVAGRPQIALITATKERG